MINLTNSSLNDPCNFELTYQITKLIQSRVDESQGMTQEGGVLSDHQKHFCNGPNLDHQTPTGLYLEEVNGMPAKIHTPCGTLTVLDNDTSPSADCKKIMNSLKKPLGLELVTQQETGNGSTWEITKWMGQPLVRSQQSVSQVPSPHQVQRLFAEFMLSGRCPCDNTKTI